MKNQTAQHRRGRSDQEYSRREMGCTGATPATRIAFATVWHDHGVMMAALRSGTADLVHPMIGTAGSAFQHPPLPRRTRGRCASRCARSARPQDDHFAARPRRTTSSVDVVCTGRFYDFFEKRERRLGLVRSRIGEKIASIRRPSAPTRSTPRAFSNGFLSARHLAYLQTLIGYEEEHEHAKPHRT